MVPNSVKNPHHKKIVSRTEKTWRPDNFISRTNKTNLRSCQLQNKFCSSLHSWWSSCIIWMQLSVFLKNYQLQILQYWAAIRIISLILSFTAFIFIFHMWLSLDDFSKMALEFWSNLLKPKNLFRSNERIKLIKK